MKMKMKIKMMTTPEDLQEGFAVRGQTQSITLWVIRQAVIGQ
jgi:hypothetical protein